MPINVPKCPPMITSLLRRELKKLLKVKYPFGNGGSKPDIQFSLSLPHPLYILPLEDESSLQNLKKTRVTGWRYIVTEREQKYAAEIYYDKNGKNPWFFGIREGPVVDNFLAVMDFIQKHDRVAHQAYELCLIKIPILYVMALWLKSPKGDQDIILPFEPMGPAPTSPKIHSQVEFMDLLKRRAQETDMFKK